jgi:hypothetical protein
LILYPPVYTLCLAGTKAIFAYFAEDAFYYLTTAKNSGYAFLTFDGERSTNGFHPLWQYLLTGLFKLIDRNNLEAQLYLTYFVGLLFSAVGFAFAYRAVHRTTGSLWAPFWLIPGPFYLFFTSTSTARYGYSPWACVNGMETSLSILFAGIFLFLLVDRYAETCEGALPLSTPYEVAADERRVLSSIGVVAGFMILARLDDFFLLVGLAAFAIMQGGSRKAMALRGAYMCLPSLFLLGMYFIFNYVTNQTILPVSGLVKATPTAAFSGNMTSFLRDFIPPFHHLIRPEKYNLIRDWPATAFRTSAMMVPMIFGIFLLASIFRECKQRPEHRHDYVWLVPLLVYIILKSLYNLLNVRYWNQGHWYYPVSILMMNFIVIIVGHRSIRLTGLLQAPLLRRGFVLTFVCMYLFQSAAVIFRGVSYGEWPYNVWLHREELSSRLKELDPDAKLVDRSDGIFSYVLGVPAVTLSGFTVDTEGYAARNNDRLLQYYVARGFRVTWDGVPGWPLPKEFRYTPFYIHNQSHVTFLRIESSPQDVAPNVRASGPDSNVRARPERASP